MKSQSYMAIRLGAWRIKKLGLPVTKAHMLCIYRGNRLIGICSSLRNSERLIVSDAQGLFHPESVDMRRDCSSSKIP